MLNTSPFHTETPRYLHNGGSQFSAIICSHRTEQLQRKAAPVCHFIQQAGAADPKEANICVCFHLDPPCSLESDKIHFFCLKLHN